MCCESDDECAVEGFIYNLCMVSFAIIILVLIMNNNSEIMEKNGHELNMKPSSLTRRIELRSL